MLYILSLVVQQIGTNFGEAIKLFLSGSISLVQLHIMRRDISVLLLTDSIARMLTNRPII